MARAVSSRETNKGLKQLKQISSFFIINNEKSMQLDYYIAMVLKTRLKSKANILGDTQSMHASNGVKKLSSKL